ncbi:putative membrane peptidase YdiL [Capsicum galapagoense]
MNALLIRGPAICVSSLNFTQHFHYHFYNTSNFFPSRINHKCNCIKNKDTQISLQGFSVLRSDTHCDMGSLWSSMAFYLLSVHVPLSFGGLSVVTSILHCSVLDPQTEALSLVVLQMLELIVVLILLRSTGKPKYKLRDFFQEKHLIRERNWLLASALGFGLLVLLVIVASIIADMLIGTKEVNNPILKEILSSGPISMASCILVYCVITPLLEEIVYRGFFLTRLSSTMKWQQAVIVSSVVFSAVHFSAENFIQLFIIGLILGSSYCWSGNLRSSVVIHSLYNALTLLITYAS